jgi:PiT family inorganic phosphate transporter
MENLWLRRGGLHVEGPTQSRRLQLPFSERRIAAELVAAATIAGADMYGLPVSTTHVLSSGVAGTMAANGSGLQLSTIRNIALAWVLTLPMAMTLSGGLYLLFVNLF